MIYVQSPIVSAEIASLWGWTHIIFDMDAPLNISLSLLCGGRTQRREYCMGRLSTNRHLHTNRDIYL